MAVCHFVNYFRDGTFECRFKAEVVSKSKPVISVRGSRTLATGLTFEELSGMETPYEKPADTYQSGALEVGRNPH